MQSPAATPMKTAKPLAFGQATRDAPPRVCVVAEIGVNHDGDADRAARLIDAAAQAGADAVKFQYFHPDRLLSNQAELAGYQRGKAASQHALLAKLALPIEALASLGESAQAVGLGFIVTPFSPADVRDLAGLNLSAVKTASPDAVNTPLLEAVFALGLPVLVSTGTCTLGELETAAQMLAEHPAGGVFLQCVSSYPTPPGQAGLNGMAALSQRYALPVGYSDHTPALHTGAVAAGAGAVVLEKHLTHDRDARGPDHAASLDTDGLAQYVANVRDAERMLGPVIKTVDPLEADVRRVSRQSICAVRTLAAGHVLTSGDVTVKRPGTGIAASTLREVLGRPLARPVAANDLLMPGDLG
ncbi:N-acetylneuraminate synthase family protein [Phycisphaeraceae bacterium D3-23]